MNKYAKTRAITKKMYEIACAMCDFPDELEYEGSVRMRKLINKLEEEL